MEENNKKKKKKITFERVRPLFRSPIRARIVHELNMKPMSIPLLSDRISSSRQKVNYHMKALAKENIVTNALVEKMSTGGWNKDVGFKLTSNGEKIAEVLDPIAFPNEEVHDVDVEERDRSEPSRKLAKSDDE